MAIITLRKVVTCKVNLVDPGELDPEAGEVAFKDEGEQLESAFDWAEASWDEPAGAEEFVEISSTDWERI